MWKTIRISVLLVILVIVALDAWRDQNQNWNQPIHVVLHPINADGQPQTEHYIQQLKASDFTDAKVFLQQQAQNYRKQPTYFDFILGRQLHQLPPKIPDQANMLQVMLWSLKFRFYAWWQHQPSDGNSTVTLYLNYYDPQTMNELKHSTALEKGRIGVVNLFASTRQQQQNNVVLTHELLHAFGATDKYNLETGQPIYPVGYVNPDQQPRYPQKMAELMAGVIPISSQSSKMPLSLEQTIIGSLTAQEIGWLKP